jgi:hypothetical protein
MPLNTSELASYYKGKKYSQIITLSDGILESLAPDSITFLIKSIIHTTGEDDPRVKLYLFLMLYATHSLQFRESFSISFGRIGTYTDIITFSEKFDGIIESFQPSTPIAHIIERLERHLRTLP